MNNFAIITTVLIVTIFIVMWMWNEDSTPKRRISRREGYSHTAERHFETLSESGREKRSPVKTYVKGDGMEANPHYQSDKSDRLVPLEHGGVDFYHGRRRLQAGRMFEEFQEGYKGRGNYTHHIINDSKARRDMVDSGDMTWHRTLQNAPTAHHARSDTPVTHVSDLTRASPSDLQQGLYHPGFHQH
jgi:hypothetical protein